MTACRCLNGALKAPDRQGGASRIIHGWPFCFVATVHKDISERLPAFNRPLYLQVKQVLDVNKAQRHIRGGIATRKKYRGV